MIAITIIYKIKMKWIFIIYLGEYLSFLNIQNMSWYRKLKLDVAAVHRKIK